MRDPEFIKLLDDVMSAYYKQWESGNRGFGPREFPFESHDSWSESLLYKQLEEKYGWEEVIYGLSKYLQKRIKYWDIRTDEGTAPDKKDFLEGWRILRRDYDDIKGDLRGQKIRHTIKNIPKEWKLIVRACQKFLEDQNVDKLWQVIDKYRYVGWTAGGHQEKTILYPVIDKLLVAVWGHLRSDVSKKEYWKNRVNNAIQEVVKLDKNLVVGENKMLNKDQLKKLIEQKSRYDDPSEEARRRSGLWRDTSSDGRRGPPYFAEDEGPLSGQEGVRPDKSSGLSLEQVYDEIEGIGRKLQSMGKRLEMAAQEAEDSSIGYLSGGIRSVVTSALDRAIERLAELQKNEDEGSQEYRGTGPDKLPRSDQR